MGTIDQETGRRRHTEAEQSEVVGSKVVQERRQYSKAYKRRVVEEALGGGDSVSVVARRHDINTNLLFNWRKQYLAGRYDEGVGAGSLIPVAVSASTEVPTSAHVGDSAQKRSAAERLKIVLSGGHRLVVEGAVNPVVLRTALEVLTA